MLIIICGLPGVGKSTVGKMLREKLKNVLIESDQLKSTKKILEELKKRNFLEKEIKKSVYNTLFRNGVRRLAQGGSVILNATFFKKVYRDQAEKLAKKFGVKFYIIEVKCPEEITLKRIDKRHKNGESEVTAKVYYIIKSQFEPFKRKKLVVDNAGDLKNLEKQIDEIITRDF